MIESDGLLIKEVTRKNAGTYTCRARVPQTGELEERDVRLDVSHYFQCEGFEDMWKSCYYKLPDSPPPVKSFHNFVCGLNK